MRKYGGAIGGIVVLYNATDFGPRALGKEEEEEEEEEERVGCRCSGMGGEQVGDVGYK